MTLDETVNLIGTLKMFWPEHRTGNPRAFAAAWHLVLRDFSYEDLQEGVRRYMLSATPFFPQPGQLVEMIADKVFDDLVPETAWAEVQTKAMRYPFGPEQVLIKRADGLYQQIENPGKGNDGPPMSHQLISEAVRSIGWRSICRDSDESGELRKSFYFTLRNLKERAKKQHKFSQGGPALPDAGAFELGEGE